MNRRDLSLLAALSALTWPAHADVVVFTNGDQVQGRIVSMVDGELTIDSAIAGRIKAPMSLVSTFRTDDAAQVVLKDGTTVHQQIQSAEAGSIQVGPEGTLVPQDLEVEQISEINPPPEGIWHGKITASLDVNSGNTEKQEYDGGLSIGRETSHDLIKTWGTYEGDKAGTGDERVTTKRELHVGTRYQRNLSPRNYWYVQNVIDREAQADLDLRIRLGPGLGRRLVDTEKWKLTGEGGLAWIKEEFTSDESEDNSYMAARVFWDALRRVNPRLELFHTGEWFPSLESFKDHLVEIQAGARTRLTQRLSLEGKVIWDYDTTPAEDRERQDVEYLLSLLIDF
jgi:putative salt-induced outer membrane protein YdiY